MSCIVTYPKPVSLSKIGPISGAEEYNPLKGATFETQGPVFNTYTWYMSRRLPVPWLAQRAEALYLNRIKARSEPPVMTYREIILGPISQNMNPIIEGFDRNGSGIWGLVFFMMIIIVIVWLFCDDNKKIFKA